jgi:hypothetical protein
VCDALEENCGAGPHLVSTPSSLDTIPVAGCTEAAATRRLAAAHRPGAAHLNDEARFLDPRSGRPAVTRHVVFSGKSIELRSLCTDVGETVAAESGSGQFAEQAGVIRVSARSNVMLAAALCLESGQAAS